MLGPADSAALFPLHSVLQPLAPSVNEILREKKGRSSKSVSLSVPGPGSPNWLWLSPRPPAPARLKSCVRAPWVRATRGSCCSITSASEAASAPPWSLESSSSSSGQGQGSTARAVERSRAIHGAELRARASKRTSRAGPVSTSTTVRVEDRSRSCTLVSCYGRRCCCRLLLLISILRSRSRRFSPTTHTKHNGKKF